MPAKLPEAERESRRKARIRARNQKRKERIALPKFSIPRGVGRPVLYDGPAHCARAYKLALLGLTDAEIAEQFGINPDTLTAWKNDYPEFSVSLNDGKTPFDAEVAVSMGQRARGYDQPAVKIFMPPGSVDAEGNPKPVYAPYMEHYPADVTAGFRWLFNRQRDRWKDRQPVDVNMTVEHRIAAMSDEERMARLVELTQRAQQVITEAVVVPDDEPSTEE